MAEIFGKFGGADQLRNAVPQLPEPEMSFPQDRLFPCRDKI
jgi:hypothetical protein